MDPVLLRQLSLIESYISISKQELNTALAILQPAIERIEDPANRQANENIRDRYIESFNVELRRMEESRNHILDKLNNIRG